MSTVRVNTTSYAHTHVATNLLRGLKRIVQASGLSTASLIGTWSVLEDGVATWLGTGHLQTLVLEVFDPDRRAGNDLVGRFDFAIDYGYYSDGDGELWYDPDSIAFAVRKAGGYLPRCQYRVVATTAPGRPDVAGWSTTSLRETTGFQRHTTGTAVGGGALGANLAYYTRTA
ncbi:hypothetical protein ACVGOW_01320 [Pseudonocardia saturnea]